MKEYKDCRNLVLPTNLHIPDPEAHVKPDGRVYVYGSWDQEENIYCSKEYRVISSENMVDWTDHGISFDSSKVPWVFDQHAPKYPSSIDWSKPTPFLKK
jgi:arabinoxylan arabinofuranohydrolase